MAYLVLNESSVLKVAEKSNEIFEKIKIEREEKEPNANYKELTAEIKAFQEKNLAEIVTQNKTIKLNSKRILYFYD